MTESIAFSQFVPSSQHPWGDITRRLVCEDVYKQNFPDSSWNAEIKGWMGLERRGAAPYEYHGLYALQNSDQLLSVGALHFDHMQPYLAILATPEEHRGKGYGSLMLSHMETVARRAGYASLALDCRPSLQEFYVSHDYYATQRGPRLFKKLL